MHDWIKTWKNIRTLTARNPEKSTKLYSPQQNSSRPRNEKSVQQYASCSKKSTQLSKSTKLASISQFQTFQLSIARASLPQSPPPKTQFSNPLFILLLSLRFYDVIFLAEPSTISTLGRNEISPRACKTNSQKPWKTPRKTRGTMRILQISGWHRPGSHSVSQNRCKC